MNQKKMMLDSSPSPSGTFRLEDNPGENATALFVPEDERAGKRLYSYHACKVAQTKPAALKGD